MADGGDAAQSCLQGFPRRNELARALLCETLNAARQRSRCEVNFSYVPFQIDRSANLFLDNDHFLTRHSIGHLASLIAAARRANKESPGVYRQHSNSPRRDHMRMNRAVTEV